LARSAISIARRDRNTPAEEPTTSAIAID
jgi:hypothetical protein